MSLDLSKVATKLFNKLATFGYIKIERTTGAISNPIAGEDVGGVTVITPLSGAVLDAPLGLDPDKRLQLGDKNVLLDKAFEPIMSDTVLIPNDSGVDEKYRITGISGINHAGIRQFYSVICSA